jgi:hypothetical protein
MQLLEAIADAAASYQIQPVVTVGDPTLLPLAQDYFRVAFERRGLSESYDPGCVRFVAPSQLSLAAGAAAEVTRGEISANLLAGAFGPEATLVTDAGERRGLPQAAAAADLRALAALYPAVDELAIGEELFAVGAQLTTGPGRLAGLMAEDLLRIVLIVAIVGAAVAAFFGF